jgi:hypothetical protein
MMMILSLICQRYELQILFRMEILQSEVGASIGESTKHRFVKHICLLLETIQCHLKGGFFGDWSLDAYVGKIINNRYAYIYTKNTIFFLKQPIVQQLLGIYEACCCSFFGAVQNEHCWCLLFLLSLAWIVCLAFPKAQILEELPLLV